LSNCNSTKHRHPLFYECSIYKFSLQWSVFICTYWSLNEHFCYNEQLVFINLATFTCKVHGNLILCFRFSLYKQISWNKYTSISSMKEPWGKHYHRKVWGADGSVYSTRTKWNRMDWTKLNVVLTELQISEGWIKNDTYMRGWWLSLMCTWGTTYWRTGNPNYWGPWLHRYQCHSIGHQSEVQPGYEQTVAGTSESTKSVKDLT
jgi:hypothetical protein